TGCSVRALSPRGSSSLSVEDAASRSPLYDGWPDEPGSLSRTGNGRYWMKTSIRAVVAAAMIGSVMAVQATEQTTVWEYRDTAVDKKCGDQLTLRFTCVHPAMELKSVWRALPGPGPVENEVFVENRSGSSIVFPPTLAAAKIGLLADGAVTLHRARKTQVGVGEVFQTTIGANADFTTDSSIIPFLLLGVGE